MEYWEHVWSVEDPVRISALQDAWARSCGEIVELFRSNGVETVCDAACGFGAYTLAMAAGGFTVSAFDISPTAVELTRRGLERRELFMGLEPLWEHTAANGKHRVVLRR